MNCKPCRHCGYETELIDGLCPQCHAEYMGWVNQEGD